MKQQPVMLTLRDYFASCALTGMCSAWYCNPSDHIAELPVADIVSDAYDVADAMLAERAKKA